MVEQKRTCLVAAALVFAAAWASCDRRAPQAQPAAQEAPLSVDQALAKIADADRDQQAEGVVALRELGSSAHAELIARAGAASAHAGQRRAAVRALGLLGIDSAPALDLMDSHIAGADAALATAARISKRRLLGRSKLDLSRIAVIGASVSAGFGGATVAELVDQAIAGEHSVVSFADLFTSQNPLAKTRAQVDRALASAPTTVFAIDSLFWYVYVSADFDYRLQRLEVGLAEMERFSMPLLVGDVPHMRDAHPIMLPPSAIPPPEQLARFNQRIHEWARSRPDVYVIPFSTWIAPLLRGDKIALAPGGEPIDSGELMTLDKLHPNPAGVRYILTKLDRELEIEFPETPVEALAFD